MRPNSVRQSSGAGERYQAERVERAATRVVPAPTADGTAEELVRREAVAASAADWAAYPGAEFSVDWALGVVLGAGA